MFNILFVCTGNTCRSCMAEGIMKDLTKKSGMEDKVYISSAGTGVNLSLPASDNAVLALQEIDIDISGHLSRPLNRQLLEDSDLVLGMTGAHKSHILKIMPEAEVKTFTLIEYATDNKTGDIEDPYFMDLDTYIDIRDELMRYLKIVAEKIKDSEK